MWLSGGYAYVPIYLPTYLTMFPYVGVGNKLHEKVEYSV